MDEFDLRFDFFDNVLLLLEFRVVVILTLQVLNVHLDYGALVGLAEDLVEGDVETHFGDLVGLHIETVGGHQHVLLVLDVGRAQHHSAVLVEGVHGHGG